VQYRGVPEQVAPLLLHSPSYGCTATIVLLLLLLLLARRAYSSLCLVQRHRTLQPVMVMVIVHIDIVGICSMVGKAAQCEGAPELLVHC
jgi:hypothetical protein